MKKFLRGIRDIVIKDAANHQLDRVWSKYSSIETVLKRVGDTALMTKSTSLKIRLGMQIERIAKMHKKANDIYEELEARFEDSEQK